MGKRQNLRNSSDFRRQRILSISFALAVALLPRAYGSEKKASVESSEDAAKKVVAAYLAAFEKGEFAAAKACHSKATLKDHKNKLTPQAFKDSRLTTRMMSISKTEKNKDGVLVRLKIDLKKAKTKEEKRVASLFKNESFILCLIREKKSWKIDQDLSQKHTERIKKRAEKKGDKKGAKKGES